VEAHGLTRFIGPDMQFYPAERASAHGQSCVSPATWPFATSSTDKGESIMGKYVLGWFLGVPVFVLVIAYLIFH
jgi:hypothetical protein